MSFKKNDKVKYQVGQHGNTTRGIFIRRLKKGSKVPSSSKNLRTTLPPGHVLKRDTALVLLKDGTYRLVGEGYLKKG